MQPTTIFTSAVWSLLFAENENDVAHVENRIITQSKNGLLLAAKHSEYNLVNSGNWALMTAVFWQEERLKQHSV